MLNINHRLATIHAFVLCQAMSSPGMVAGRALEDIMPKSVC